MGYATPLFDRRMTFIADKSLELSFCQDSCRLCGQRESSLWNLFEASDTNGNLNLAEKIFLCLNIMAEISDGLPDRICEKCMTVVLCFFEFRQQCLNHDTLLRKSLSAHNQHKLGGCQKSTKKAIGFSES